MSSEIEVRALASDEFAALRRAVAHGFHSDHVAEAEDHFEKTIELDRARCAFDAGRMVGTLGAYSFDLAVPGATLPTAGTTIVTVRATHRRRGLLRRMMAAHFEDARERGEPLAALWASESAIYRRFGFGYAADMVQFRAETAYGAFTSPSEVPGRLRLLEPEEAGKILPEVYESHWRERPGCFARSPSWWEHRRLLDARWDRRGASHYRYVVIERKGRPAGYLQYRVREKWDDGGLPRAELQVVELLGEDADTRAALWRYALDVDLVDQVVAWNQPPDCELPWLLADPRRAVRTQRDSLWLRVFDVPAALAGRRYASEDALVLQVHDASRGDNADCFLLEGGPDGARCQRTDRAADLTLDVAELGAVYLGGFSLRALARAGRVAGSAEALARADRMFGWDPAPWCPEVF